MSKRLRKRSLGSAKVSLWMCEKQTSTPRVPMEICQFVRSTKLPITHWKTVERSGKSPFQTVAKSWKKIAFVSSAVLRSPMLQKIVQWKFHVMNVEVKHTPPWCMWILRRQLVKLTRTHLLGPNLGMAGSKIRVQMRTAQNQWMYHALKCAEIKQLAGLVQKSFSSRFTPTMTRLISRKRMQLDESTARRQLKSPQSLSGRSIHLTLFTKWSWSW